jgi:hypothetical protein
MVFNRFSAYSSHNSLEAFHRLKQSTSVADYIQRFEELMALMQMEYPRLTEPYFVSSFLAGLKEGIKHYLIPHNPQSLSDAYWQAKELEKGILIKKSLLSPSTSYPKPTTTLPSNLPSKLATPNQTLNQAKPSQSTPPQPPRPLLPKPREPNKCWGVKNL